MGLLNGLLLGFVETAQQYGCFAGRVRCRCCDVWASAAVTTRSGITARIRSIGCLQKKQNGFVPGNVPISCSRGAAFVRQMSLLVEVMTRTEEKEFPAIAVPGWGSRRRSTVQGSDV